jgi:hypothetical protein
LRLVVVLVDREVDQVVGEGMRVKEWEGGSHRCYLRRLVVV